MRISDVDKGKRFLFNQLKKRHLWRFRITYCNFDET